MLLSIRHGWLAKVLICALLAFAVGPGLGLHALGDLAHEAQHDHDQTQFEMVVLDAVDDLGGTCDFDHEHDESHAASVNVACLGQPAGADDVFFSYRAVAYRPAQQSAPEEFDSSGPGKPPRPSHSLI